jgi:DNA-binding GntR family transcriptional regulator
LRHALDRVRVAMNEGDMVNLLRVKDQFYSALTAGAHNPFVVSALRTIHARAQVFRALSLSAPGRSTDSIAELDRIVSAIEAGDPAAARRACEDHVRRAGEVAHARLVAEGRKIAADA